MPPKVITYYVVQPPQYGYLDIEYDSVSKQNIFDTNKQFTQDTINSNQVRYVQSSANETRDYIVLNVTNGIVWLNNIVLNIIVVPEHLYLGSAVLEVHEGSEAVLSSTNLFVLTDYYKNKVTDYLIIQPVKHGCLKKNNQCNLSNNFSHKDLENGLLKVRLNYSSVWKE